jgi:hypothetical protein
MEMTRGGNAFTPEIQFPVALDEVVVSARALPVAYEWPDAEPLEDTSREKLGAFALFVCQTDPRYAHLRPLVERTIAEGRRGDRNADGALAHTEELIASAEIARALGALLVRPKEKATASVSALAVA